MTGNPNADMISLKMVDDRKGESTMKKGGKVTATNVRELSADGKVLTITSTGTTADGKPRKDCRSSRNSETAVPHRGRRALANRSLARFDRPARARRSAIMRG